MVGRPQLPFENECQYRASIAFEHFRSYPPTSFRADGRSYLFGLLGSMPRSLKSHTNLSCQPILIQTPPPAHPLQTNSAPDLRPSSVVAKPLLERDRDNVRNPCSHAVTAAG